MMGDDHEAITIVRTLSTTIYRPDKSSDLAGEVGVVVNVAAAKPCMIVVYEIQVLKGE